MAIFAPAVHGSSTAYQISNSLRFDGADDYLSRTFGTPTDATKQTWRFSCKRSKLGATQNLLSCGTSGSSYVFFRFQTDDTLYVVSENGGVQYLSTTSAVFRDPTGWLDILVVFDTGNATAANRLKVYVNGVQQSFSGSPTYPSSSYSGLLGSAIEHNLGRRKDAADSYLDGYLSDIYFIDGQALTPSSFGELNADNVWVPKAYTGTYGNNGFHLDFSDGTSTTTLGYDAAGSNDWTLTGMTRAAGVNECWMVDTPTDNFATLNPLDAKNVTLSNGNLQVTYATASWSGARASCKVPKTGSYKWEIKPTTMTYGFVGVATATATLTSTGYGDANVFAWYLDSGEVRYGGTNVATGKTVAVNDICEVRIVDGAVSFYKNNTLQHTFTQTLSDISGDYFPAVWIQSGAVHHYNFGQRAFDYSPTGFKALCTANGAVVSIPDPSLDMDVVLDTGANIKSACEAVYGDGLYVIKDRANSNNWQWIDYVRGTSAVLQSNSTGAETTYSAPSGNSVGFCWKAGGTPTTDNVAGAGNVPTAGSVKIDGVNMSSALAGTIAATRLSANTVAGFSIVTYTGTGANATVAHGLGVAPKMVIVRTRGITNNWRVWHTALAGTEEIYLNLTNAKGTDATSWNSTTPTSTVINLGSSGATNASSGNLVAYCFAEISGYSKAGSFTGNNNADGVYIHLGFRARFFLVKCHNSTSPWYIYDSARSTYNVTKETLQAESSGSENTTLRDLDFTAFGVKMRTSNDPNGNGASNQYIYFAIAEYPNGSNVSPAPAR